MKIITVLMLMTLAVTFAGTVGAQDSWTPKASFEGGGRFGATGIGIGDKGYIGLGVDLSGYLTDFWEYDPVTNAWSQKADFEGTARMGATGFTIGGKGYIGTGSNTPGDINWQWFNDLWEYDPATNDWTQKASFNALGRGTAVGFSIGGKGYIGTGQYRQDRFHNAIYLSDFWEYDPVADSWLQRANVPEQGRHAASGFAIGDKGYVGMGVYYYDTRKKDWWQYDPVANTWTRKNDFPGLPRYHASSLTIGDRGYVGMGGYYSLLKDFWEYNPATDSWCRKADYPENAYALAAFAVGSKGYIGTGSTSSADYSAAFNEYTPNTLDVLIPDAYAVTPGGEANTIYLGYGPTSLTLSAAASGGTPAYQYLWDNNSTSATRTVSPAVVGTFTYTVTVTDANGCQDVAETTVTVKDVRCGNNMDKVQVCIIPPGNSDVNISTCLNPNAVAQLLERGGYLGACQTASLPEVIVYPNPNNGSFHVQISNAVAPVEIIVTDRHGKVFARHSVNADSEEQTINVDLGDTHPGLYFVKVVQGQRLSVHKIFVRR
ncbi:MAG: kelch repeat-containing protein [Chryseosolibacter sp.]